MEEPRFNFGNIVVVEGNLIGIICKCWDRRRGGLFKGYHYEVYVRSYNGINDYEESEIQQFIFDKELSEEALEYYK